MNDCIKRRYERLYNTCSMKMNGFLSKIAYDYVAFNKGDIRSSAHMEDIERCRNYHVIYKFPLNVCCITEQIYNYVCKPSMIIKNVAIICKSVDKANELCYTIYDRYKGLYQISITDNVVRICSLKDTKEAVYKCIQHYLPEHLIDYIVELSSFPLELKSNF